MEELLREVFTAHYRDVYGYLYSLSRDAALSEDLASEVFLEAVRSISGFRGESDVKTWLRCSGPASRTMMETCW